MRLIDDWDRVLRRAWSIRLILLAALLSIWSVYDANSGKGLTRIHCRSIAGWTIVAPTSAETQTAKAK